MQLYPSDQTSLEQSLLLSSSSEQAKVNNAESNNTFIIIKLAYKIITRRLYLFDAN